MAELDMNNLFPVLQSVAQTLIWYARAMKETEFPDYGIGASYEQFKNDCTRFADEVCRFMEEMRSSKDPIPVTDLLITAMKSFRQLTSIEAARCDTPRFIKFISEHERERRKQLYTATATATGRWIEKLGLLSHINFEEEEEDCR